MLNEIFNIAILEPQSSIWDNIDNELGNYMNKLVYRNEDNLLW